MSYLFHSHNIAETFWKQMRPIIRAGYKAGRIPGPTSTSVISQERLDQAKLFINFEYSPDLEILKHEGSTYYFEIRQFNIPEPLLRLPKKKVLEEEEIRVYG